MYSSSPWYCVLCIAYCLLCIMYYVLCIVYCVLCIVCCALCIVFLLVFYAFLSRDDNNPRRVNSFRSIAWTGQTFTSHTTLHTEQNQLAIKVSANK